MHIVIASDSFKSTATAAQATAGLAAGVAEVFPDACLSLIPMADGGEGTAQVLAQALPHADTDTDTETVTLPTTDATGQLTEASYFFDPATATAYIDVAAASGLPAVAGREDPLHADTYGTGVLLADAASRGATHIVLGLGGSATIDGGMGILVALGAAPHNARGFALPKGGAPLVELDHIDTAQLNVKAAGVRFSLVGDTTCPPAQAAAMFGPQKGASGQDIALLTGALLRLCEVTGISAQRSGFGAAGAIPVALTWLSRTIWGDESHVTVLPGARFVAKALRLDTALANADAVITGEGAFDAQSLTGKVVGTIAEMAKDAGVPVGIAAGRVDEAAVPEGVRAVALSQTGPLDEQLRVAGRTLAEQLVRPR